MNRIESDKSEPVSDLPEGSVYYEKLANKYHTAKYVMLAVLIVFVMVTCIIGRSELKAENFKYFFKYFQINPFSSAAAYEDITYTGNADMKFSMYKSDLLVLCDGNLTLYNMAGRAVLSAKTDSADTFDSGGKYLAVYRRGSRSAVLYNSFSDVYTINTPYPITDVCVSGEGGFAVVTSEKNIRSSVLVYNKAFSLVYTWKSADKYVACTELSENGDKAGIFAFGTSGGISFAELIVKKTGSDSTVCDYTYEGEQPYGTAFTDGGGIIAVTDRAARFYSKNGALLTEYFFDGTLICADIKSERPVFCTQSAGSGGTAVTVFSSAGKQTESRFIGQRVYGTASDEKNTYLLCYDRVYACGESTAEYGADGGALGIFMLDDGDVLLCYPSGTKLLETEERK